MDVVGFALATGFLVAVYAVFGVIGRVLDVVSAGVRATVAPTMLSGFRAWTEPAGDGVRGPAGDVRDPDDAGGDDGDARTADERRHDPGLVVPVSALAPRSRQRFSAV